ncbi:MULTISPECIES: UDP-glucose--hexose-1-phosphate uridylyltransferase [unclassified Sphaerochaeta]|jgi:UDPglucose--hexose-1-phosphate uridylyltransferase|uniref:UDP-glucose--hexose-1-phosphate uridylyltransferase n=1 Tax=unclassified Sphaerochaeta TaxID=2637943 RepID=UPI0025D3F520|nr:UDP-glucose--hexose-1-phosphate uridylyltransferase [Sphaerochaeta sp. UBA5856]
MDIQFDTHNRYNPLLGEWVKVSPHRTKRPWNGQVEKPNLEELSRYDSTCYLCPGNKRSSGERNPEYKDVYVFDNDFASLLPTTPNDRMQTGPNGLLKAYGERGRCRVVCFSPRHDLTLSRMSTADIEKVLSAWTEEYEKLGESEMINYVQIFENRGAIMGCSNPHPHAQIWSEEIIPDIPAKELANEEKYFQTHKSHMLLDYAQYEMETGERVVIKGRHFIAVVPFWAVWPYETMILGYKRNLQSFSDLASEERADLAWTMQQLGIRYDNLFQTSFPYSMGVHQKPTDGQAYPAHTMHLHYFPPLLRSATVKKFMVGYEMMAMPQRDITAEQAAQKLSSQSDVHYRNTLH